MPKVRNKYNIVSIVSEKEAEHMVKFNGATRLNEPDMRPGAPLDIKLKAGEIPPFTGHKFMPKTIAQQQAEAEERKVKIEAEIAAKEAAEIARMAPRAAPPSENTGIMTSKAATIAEAQAEIEARANATAPAKRAYNRK